ncbi:hypothetical protein L227DRAFT_587771 [Lentinus tigrinus ALCF2SS1-6]|uniref:Uncharacterized protein n=1 Tax=Lentinus tigrinus ALCF2SS1-6 TaxID=1328759 RepID=A0A5C2S122_9APHY|nr:hypothetical protein L227DRAFT_587771 [Lentinus tigrinus ALCF2SS1-6]
MPASKPYHRPTTSNSLLFAEQSGSGSVASSSRLSASSSTPSPAQSTKRTMRDVCLSHIRKRFPPLKPRHDFDILALGDDRYKGSEEDIYASLDQELSSQVYQGVVTGVSDVFYHFILPLMFSQLKPAPGDVHVFIRPIPHSRDSIRLFPGSPALKEYCMDFVTTASGQPVNSPFKFELWSVGTSSGRHAGVRLRSLESSLGCPLKDILSGEEKFVLTDGMPVRFTVPIRLDYSDTSDVDVDELDFPRHVA